MSSQKVPQRSSSSSFMQRAIRKAFSGWGAKIGATWVGLLIILAVFAPFLANSVPLIVSEQGAIHFPFIRYLTVEDVVVLGAFISFLLLYFVPLKGSMARKSGYFAILLTATVVFANLFVKPPELIIYDDFRLMENNRTYDWVIKAPIPFSPRDYQRDSTTTPLQPPLKGGKNLHLMGTEENNADVLSRMIHASRVALGIGFIATSIALFIGIIIGGLMGYFSGVVDILGMRLVEIFESIPTLFLLLTFVAFFGRNIYLIMIIIGLTSWSGYARYARAEFLKLRKQDYVQAAVASGLSLRSILFRHMLPNGVAPLLVSVSFGVASAILAEAVLSFLGLGPVEAASWGQMLNQSVKASTFNWWMAVYPGGAIFLTVFAYNLMGEALRDAIDPKAAGKAGVVE